MMGLGVRRSVRGMPGGEAHRRSPTVITRLAHPVATGFTVSVGVLLAATLAATVVNAATIVVSLILALFIALGLHPVVNILERRGLRRRTALLIVAIAFLIVAAVIVVFAVPALIRQVVETVQSLPETLAEIGASEWFMSLEATLGTDLSAAMEEAWLAIKEAASFLAVSGGLLRAGAGVIGAISSGFLVVVLTLYFVASMESMKEALAGLIPAYRRAPFAEITDEITGSVGVAIGGAVILSLINASVVFVIQFLIGSSVPFLIAVIGFFITLVPLAGSLIFLAVGTLAAFVTAGPTEALVFLVAYFAYVQIEAYYVTPRVMGRAVAVPAVLIIIGAMVGATLFGFLGALVAIPFTASILIILRRVVMPRQTARTERIEF